MCVCICCVHVCMCIILHIIHVCVYALCSRNLLECLTTAVQLIHQWLAVNGKSKNLVVPRD